MTTFFVLSGFLITSLLMREHGGTGRIDLKAFYIRRALRLYPPLLVLLLVLPLLMFALGEPDVNTYLMKAVVAGLYLSDFAAMSGFGMGILIHTWSLAVEEQFYLVWPVLLIIILAGARGNPRKALWLVTVMFVLALAWRLWGQINLDALRVYYGPDMNFFAMLGGAALASVGRLPKLPTWIGGVGMVILLVLALSRPVLGFDPGVFQGWVVLAASLTAAVVVWAASQGSVAALEVGVAKWFGGISYSLYLWHDPILKLRINGAEAESFERLFLASVAIVVGWLSWRLVERPSLRLKKRFERSTIR